MRFLLSVLILINFIAEINGQEPFFSFDLFDNEPFFFSEVKVANVEALGDSAFVSFEVQMDGYIQERSNGNGIDEGNKKKLNASYIYIIDGYGQQVYKDVVWLASDRFPDKFNLLNRPSNKPNSKVRATEKDFLERSEYDLYRWKKVYRLSEEQISEKQGKPLGEHLKELVATQTNEIVQSFKDINELMNKQGTIEGDELPEKLYRTEIFLSAFGGGKLKSVRTGVYSREPAGENGLFSGDYDYESTEKYKLKMEDIFQNENKRFTAENHNAHDPITGDIVLYAGVKIKKDKSPKDNKYFEHMILTYNYKGEEVNRVVLKEEDPWEVGTMKRITIDGYQTIAGNTYNYMVIVQNPPNEDWVTTSDKQRFLVIDNKGEVVFSKIVPCIENYPNRVQRIELLHDSILLVNTYGKGENQSFAGIYTLNLNSGHVESKLIQDERLNMLETIRGSFSRKIKLKNQNVQVNSEGSYYILDLLYFPKEENPLRPSEDPTLYFNYLFYRIDHDGKVSNVTFLERQYNQFKFNMKVDFVNESEEYFFLNLQERIDAKDTDLRKIAIQKDNMSIKEFTLPGTVYRNGIMKGKRRAYFVVWGPENSDNPRLLAY